MRTPRRQQTPDAVSGQLAANTLEERRGPRKAAVGVDVVALGVLADPLDERPVSLDTSHEVAVGGDERREVHDHTAVRPGLAHVDVGQSGGEAVDVDVDAYPFLATVEAQFALAGRARPTADPGSACSSWRLSKRNVIAALLSPVAMARGPGL